MFPIQIPSPQPSPRLGGERDAGGAVSNCARISEGIFRSVKPGRHHLVVSR